MLYTARKINDSAKFQNWLEAGRSGTADLDEFSSVVGVRDDARSLKRYCYSLWAGHFERIIIFKENALVAYRHMAFGKRWVNV